jgi:hypothetical protein
MDRGEMDLEDLNKESKAKLDQTNIINETWNLPKCGTYPYKVCTAP